MITSQNAMPTQSAPSRSDPRAVAHRVAETITAAGYVWGSEADLQATVQTILSRQYEVRREKSLSPRDRPDFLVDVDGLTIAVEIKVSGSRNPILRQIGRYAAYDEVDAVVLASARRTLLAGLPPAIHGTPVAVALLAGAL